MGALQLSSGAGASPDVRLVSRVRQEGESVAEALQVLRSEGAALLVAGLSDETATAAMRFAEEQGIGLLLLTRPDTLPPNLVFTYVLGPGDEQAEEGNASSAGWAGAPRGVGLYEALGHDAVVLAALALAKLNAPRTAQPSLVKRFQRRAAAGLGSAEGDLWSSQARGFEGGRVLQRPPVSAEDSEEE